MSHEILSDQEEFDHFIKIIVIGNASVGKTALLNRYCSNLFDDSPKATIGIETRFKIV